jgi:hypothetical protein
MTVTEAVEKVKHGEYALFFDSKADLKILNIVLMNAFKKKEIRQDYGPDKYFYGNQKFSSWRAAPNNIFVEDPNKLIWVSSIGIAYTPPLNGRPGLSYNDILSSARPLKVEELEHVTILDTLRQLVVNMKERELRYDIKYHKLVGILDNELDESALKRIFDLLAEA